MKLYLTSNVIFSSHIDYWYLKMTQENISNAHVSILVSIFLFSYVCYEINNRQHSRSDHFLPKEDYYSQVWPRINSGNCVSILVVYYLFFDYGIFGSYSQH